MTTEDLLSWRTIYWKLIGLFVLFAALLSILGLWLIKPTSCGWYQCFVIPGALTKPFGELDLAYNLNADMVLWVVLAVIFVSWFVRRAASKLLRPKR